MVYCNNFYSLMNCFGIGTIQVIGVFRLLEKEPQISRTLSGNIYESVPIAHSVHLKKSYEKIVTYRKHELRKTILEIL